MNNIRTKIGEGGRIVLPAVIRQQLHLSPGDEIILQVHEDELHILTPHQALHKLQAKVKRYMAHSDTSLSLVEELIAARRLEAGHE